MQVGFSKLDNGRLCAWWAEPSKRRRFQGTTMAAGQNLPHDLAQFVVEATLAIQHGFWSLLANGATFKSVGLRRTKPGQQLIAAHRAALEAAEHVVNAHVTAWRTGAPTSARPALDDMLVRWRALAVGEELLVNWPAQRLARLAKGMPRHGLVSRRRSGSWFGGNTLSRSPGSQRPAFRVHAAQAACH
jgi:hypothetical protein